MNKDQLLSTLQPGDLILHKDTSFFSTFLTLFIDTSFTNGGIVIQDPISDTNNLYVLHTTGYNKHRFNIFLTDLDTYCNTTEILYIRKLTCNRDTHFYNRLYQCYSIICNPTASLTRFHWMKEQYNTYASHHSSDDHWCSMIAYIFVCIGALPVYFDWSKTTPDMFQPGKRSLPFQYGVLQHTVTIN